MEPYGKALTWDELATIYDRHNSGRRARTLPMDTVSDWAEKRTDIFDIHPTEGTFHLKQKEENNG